MLDDVYQREVVKIKDSVAATIAYTEAQTADGVWSKAQCENIVNAARAFEEVGLRMLRHVYGVENETV